MEPGMLRMLDLDRSGDVQREELVEWLQKVSAYLANYQRVLGFPTLEFPSLSPVCFRCIFKEHGS